MQWIKGKVVDLESMFLVRCTTLPEHVTLMGRPSTLPEHVTLMGRPFLDTDYIID